MSTAIDAHNPRSTPYEVSKVCVLAHPLYGDVLGAGHYYLESTVRGDFDEVAAGARDLGGYLASITNREEEALLERSFILESGSRFWIGLQQEKSPAAPMPTPTSLAASWDATDPGPDPQAAWSSSFGGEIAWRFPVGQVPQLLASVPSSAPRTGVRLSVQQQPGDRQSQLRQASGRHERGCITGAVVGTLELTGKEVLFEAGSETQGTSLRLEGDQLIFRVSRCGGVTTTRCWKSARR